eukprot:5096350-Prymnesium_polylepis.1
MRSADGIAAEAVMNFRTIAGLNLQHHMLQVFQDLRRYELRHSGKLGFMYGFFVGMAKATPIVLVGALYAFSVWLTIEGHCGDSCFESSMIAVNLLILLGQQIASLAELNAKVVNGFRSASAVIDFCEQRSGIDSLNEGGLKPASVVGELELRD